MKLDRYQAHFGLKLAGKRIAYCDIRKNGCSSWKTLFIDNSPHLCDGKAYPNPIGFMVRYHKIDDVAALRKYPFRVLILRNPHHRVVSGYLNQFVMRLDRRMDNLHGLVEKVCGVPAADVSFEMFVGNYLAKATPAMLNEHLWPQVWRLAPIDYTDVWPLDRMYSCGGHLFGFELADKYFKVKANTTADYARRTLRHGENHDPIVG